MPSFAVSSIAASLVVAALVYTGAMAPANAQTLDPGTRAELEAMREGEMRKLNLHARPRPAGEDGFLDAEGETRTLADWTGKVVLVNFWATWCAPCRVEKPSLDRLAAELEGEDFAVVAIATGRHDAEGIARFNREVGVEALDTYLDEPSALARSMGVPGLPVTVLLNREGEEIGRLMGGAEWDTDSARAIIRRVLELGR
jgi:thiol-disulfide isomerase/thioredoxin